MFSEQWRIGDNMDSGDSDRLFGVGNGDRRGTMAVLEKQARVRGVERVGYRNSSKLL